LPTAEAEARSVMEILARVDLSQLPWPESPMAVVMDALRFLLQGSLTESPTRGRATLTDQKNLAWCFVADNNFKPVPLRTFQTLGKKLGAGATYFTPNTFCNRRGKSGDRLRWLNSLYVDLDDPELCTLDVLDRCAEAGLPTPTVIAKTPHGLHCFWKIKRVRATKRAVRWYTALLRSVARAADGDPNAATPERFMRIPRRCLYFNPVEYELQDFLACLDNERLEEGSLPASGRVITGDILDHPSVRFLLQGVEEGKRDNTAFTLALTYKAAGYTKHQALEALTAWNLRNRPPLSVGQLRAKVRSAYQPRYRGPSACWLSSLSGVPFRYRVITTTTNREDAEDMQHRPKRGRPAVQPTVRDKFLALVQASGDILVTRESRAEIARQLGASLRTLNSVVAALVDEGTLAVSTRRLGKGYGAEATYTLCHGQTEPQNAKYNTANKRNTYGGMLGGRVEQALRPEEGPPAPSTKPNSARRSPAVRQARERHEPLEPWKKTRLRGRLANPRDVREGNPTVAPSGRPPPALGPQNGRRSP